MEIKREVTRLRGTPGHLRHRPPDERLLRGREGCEGREGSRSYLAPTAKEPHSLLQTSDKAKREKTRQGARKDRGQQRAEIKQNHWGSSTLEGLEGKTEKKRKKRKRRRNAKTITLPASRRGPANLPALQLGGWYEEEKKGGICGKGENGKTQSSRTKVQRAAITLTRLPRKTKSGEKGEKEGGRNRRTGFWQLFNCGQDR